MKYNASCKHNVLEVWEVKVFAIKQELAGDGAYTGALRFGAERGRGQ